MEKPTSKTLGLQKLSADADIHNEYSSVNENYLHWLKDLQKCKPNEQYVKF